MSGKKSRLIIAQARFLLKHFPSVAIIGARQAGKSTLLRRLLPKASFFDLEKRSDFERISVDVEFFLENESKPLILDEAQLFADLFPALRVAIDANRDKSGRFLLSGSSSPDLLKNISESLAGRVAIVELGTFLLSECYSKPVSGFYDTLVEKKFNRLGRLKPHYRRSQLLERCFIGGYPEPFLARKQKKVHENWMENYVATYLNRDVRRLFPGLNMEAYQRFLKMLAASTGQVINAAQFANSLDVSQPTIRSYLDIAEGTFFWRKQPRFQTNVKKRVVKMPRGHIRDSGLTCYLMGIRSRDQLLAHPQFGNIWESFIAEQIIGSLKALGVKFEHSFYRTHHHAEVDLILEGPFGVIPIEIKSGSTFKKEHVRTLQDFVEEYDCPAGILINSGDVSVQISPKIFQVGAAFL